ncbi:MAG: hypothetical protein WCQ99_05635 [Pseudomonadota bacterium]
MKTKSVCWGIFLTALATLVWEILITRIFSATMYYHFVFMSISLAMLGFACSGICVYLFPSFFNREKSYDQLTGTASLFSLAMMAAITIYLQVRFTPEQSLTSFYNLAKIFFFVFIPYFFSGLTITLIFKHHAKNITLIYFFDLVGAGIGCLAVVGLLFLYDAISLVFLTAFIASLAALVFARHGSARMVKRFAVIIALVSIMAFIANAYVHRFLKIKYINGSPEVGIIFEEWNPINRVTVSPDRILGHQALRINYDSAATAHMHRFDGDKTKMDYLKEIVPSFYYQVRHNADVLVIGAGGGQDVLNAYVNGNQNITAVEINPTIARLNKEVYRDFNGNLFGQKGIELFVDDGRDYIRTTLKKFDIIHLSNVDSGVASSSGAFTFVENSLYTVEAFKDYFAHLRQEGVIWINRWRFNNDLESLKVLSTCMKALEDSGVKNTERHIVMIGEKPAHAWCQALFLFKKTPFSDEEIRNIDVLREKMGLLWLHDPRARLATPFDDFIFSPNKKEFIATYPFRIQMDTDNCPFFFNFLKPIHYFWKLPQQQSHFTYPVFMFKSLFIIVFFMVIMTILMPLLLVGKAAPGDKTPVCFRWGYIFYFACLGFGFMLVEIPLIQRFILFLGQPLYAIAVILSSLLISSGIGSMIAGSFAREKVLSRLRFLIFLLCVLLVLSIYGLPLLFEHFLGAPGYLKILLTLCVISPLGIFMGMALPIGIKLLEEDGPSIIPWVWGINGACSVLGSIIAWGLSLNFGYTTTLWAATAFYFTACVIMFCRSRVCKRQPLAEAT